MEASVYRPYLTILALMALTSLALAFTVDVRLADEAGITLALPDRVGDWTGEDLRFCQNRGCEQAFGTVGLENPDVCPSCGGVLASMVKVEKDLLPPDTSVVKKRYTNPAGAQVVVSIVLSGRERASIHRPEVCLVGQGTQITGRSTVGVPLPGREPLEVMVLDLQQWWRGADGRRMEADSYYAYWFAGRDRETPHHLQRMVWMATDRIFRNVAHRWAYIAISGGREAGTDRHLEELEAFVAGLYPAVSRPSAGAGEPVHAP